MGLTESLPHLGNNITPGDRRKQQLAALCAACNRELDAVALFEWIARYVIVIIIITHHH